jgi:CheY-like chemotaxis protein/two-component sensor histidine kinase
VERLVDDLLDISRITRGKIKLDSATIEISSTINKAIEMASPLLEQRSHHIELEVPRRGLMVHGDPVRLAQVISNLLTNAAKYTEAGGRIAIRAMQEGDFVAVYVKDNGIGIGGEMLPNIFDLFVQGGRAIDRAEGGLGIGLTLVKNLVTMHGGAVEARSEGIGKGSEFVIRLPFRETGVPKADTMPQMVALPKPGKVGNRVLIVDDNIDAAETLAEVLRAEGHEVGVAFDGPHALTVVGELCPEIAILDIGLPAMDGFELAAKIKEQLKEKCPRLIALTGYGQENDRARSTEAGFEAHFVKPVDISMLIGAIAELTPR